MYFIFYKKTKKSHVMQSMNKINIFMCQLNETNYMYNWLFISYNIKQMFQSNFSSVHVCKLNMNNKYVRYIKEMKIKRNFASNSNISLNSYIHYKYN